MTTEIPTRALVGIYGDYSYPQTDLCTLGRLATASETVIISHLWVWDLREEQAAEAGHPAEEAALLSHCAVRQKPYQEDLSGTLLPKLCWFILHEKCGYWEEFFGPSLLLPAETEGCCASILITAFALQWFASPKLSSCDKGDNLHCFLLMEIWVTPLQSP